MGIKVQGFLTMAVMIMASLHINLLKTTSLLIITVITAKHIVVIAIHDTRLTTGPFSLSEIKGTRAKSIWTVAISIG